MLRIRRQIEILAEGFETVMTQTFAQSGGNQHFFRFTQIDARDVENKCANQIEIAIGQRTFCEYANLIFPQDYRQSRVKICRESGSPILQAVVLGRVISRRVGSVIHRFRRILLTSDLIKGR